MILTVLCFCVHWQCMFVYVVDFKDKLHKAQWTPYLGLCLTHNENSLNKCLHFVDHCVLVRGQAWIRKSLPEGKVSFEQSQQGWTHVFLRILSPHPNSGHNREDTVLRGCVSLTRVLESRSFPCLGNTHFLPPGSWLATCKAKLTKRAQPGCCKK